MSGMTPGPAAVVTVIDHTLASHLGPPPDGVFVVPRKAASRWRVRRVERWRPLDPDAVLDVLCALPRPGFVLVRPVAADPGAACLATTAAVVGHEVITLPGELDEAVWSVGIAFGLMSCDAERVGRVLDVVCCGPGTALELPRRSWGPTGISVPALRPTTLARWAYCAWSPCSWCEAGGLVGHRCRRCGVIVQEPASEVAA